MHYPPPTKTTLFAIWHHKLIIQLLVDMLGQCANQKRVAYPAAGRRPGDHQQGWSAEPEISTVEWH